MPKDHLGANLPVGMQSVPVEWHEDTCFPVPIQEFDYASLDRDNLAGMLKEKLHNKAELEAFFKKCVEARLQEEREKIVGALIGLVINDEKPLQALYLIAFAVPGLMDTSTISQVDLARKFGISKQAIQQGIDSYKEKLRLRQTRTQRGAAERQNMRLCNYRKSSGE